ncbi:MAG: hypothetical protein IKV57_07345 [Clostridia bacterium]|nr:hypothetical protein [Clostridia bacterium]
MGTRIRYDKKTAWEIVYSRYEGMQAKAMQLLSAEVGYRVTREPGVYTLYVLPCVRESSVPPSKCAVIIGCLAESALLQQYIRQDEVPEDGYCIRIMKNPADKTYNWILIAGDNDTALYYGAVDFLDHCLVQHSFYPNNNDETLDFELPDSTHISAPQTKRRLIFTWGHPINDYRQFIRNMARMKLNEVILWNDFCPVNAREITEYAHEWGVRVIWGFAWGWSAGQCSVPNLEDSYLAEVKQSVLERFEREYAPLHVDGIYFQSFTERSDARVGGRSIAEAVVQLVNDTAASLLETYPDLQIQFGLHATSVRNEPEAIAKTDPRVEIIWEDHDAFPTCYEPDGASNRQEGAFERTIEFIRQIIAMRPGAKAGLLYKGYCTLDWQRFAYQTGPFLLGEAHPRLSAHDTALRYQRWKYLSGQWMQYGGAAQRMTQMIHEMDPEGNLALGMAGMFDDGIWFPEAVTSRMFWNSDSTYEQTMREVAAWPCLRM